VKTSAKTAQHAVEDTFPGLSHFFENVVKDTEKGVSDLLKGLDKTTAKEQKEILSAYRKILATQIEKIDQRLKEIDKNSRVISNPSYPRSRKQAELSFCASFHIVPEWFSVFVDESRFERYGGRHDG